MNRRCWYNVAADQNCSTGRQSLDRRGCIGDGRQSFCRYRSVRNGDSLGVRLDTGFSMSVDGILVVNDRPLKLGEVLEGS